MSEEKQEKSYTLIIYSGPKDKVRKISISQNALRFLYIFLVIVVASVAILVSNLYITRQELNKKIAEIQRAEYKINYKEVELVSLEKKASKINSKTQILENYLKEVEELDKLVRNITGQGGPEDGSAENINSLSMELKTSRNPEEVFYYASDQEEAVENIDALLDELLNKAPNLVKKLEEDKKNMEDHIYVMEHTPSIWPTWGQITTLWCDGRATVWRNGLHKGIDIANRTGTPVSATASGLVIFAGWDGGYGNKIVIYHMDKYTTVYAHLSNIGVSVGDEVKQGQVIGKVGSTGHSTGSHLHYEVYVNNQPQNPKDFLP